MKYNRALDLMAAAMVFAAAGKTDKAAKAFAGAVNCKSMKAALQVIESSNKAAYAKAKSVKASDAGIPAENPGEEFREDVPENGDRVVQEATATAASLRARARKLTQQAAALEASGEDDDAELSFLDADDNTAADMDGDLDADDLDMDDGDDDFGPESASFIKAFGSRASGTAKPAVAAAKPAVAPAAKVSASSFARAVKNLNVLKA